MKPTSEIVIELAEDNVGVERASVQRKKMVAKSEKDDRQSVSKFDNLGFDLADKLAGIFTRLEDSSLLSRAKIARTKPRVVVQLYFNFLVFGRFGYIGTRVR